MQPFLKASSRWLALSGVVLLPLAQWGAENLYLIDDDRMRSATVRGRFGAPLPAAALAEGDERLRNVVRGRAVEILAALLPEPYRPEPNS